MVNRRLRARTNVNDTATTPFPDLNVRVAHTLGTMTRRKFSHSPGSLYKEVSHDNPKLPYHECRPV